MNDITNITGNLTMSSEEISTVCGARHNDVVATIERLFEKGVLRESRKTTRKAQPAGGGRPKEVYDLTKRDSLVVVSGYDDAVRAKLIDRWMELEESRKGVTVSDLLSNPSQLLVLAQGYALQIEDLKREAFVMQKDVDTLERINKAEGLYGVRETSQILQMQERKFTEWLQRNNWCFRHSGSKNLMAFADKRRAGYATHKLDTYSKPDGTEGSRETLKFTTAGIVQLAKRLNVVFVEGDIFCRQEENA